jgi:hypothetical protein
MFSPKIVCSDAFLDMPTSSRELYFQLGMRADDDGFVNPRGIMRMIGASDDDIRVLVGKRFVLPFESGVVVIKHWKMNNLVRKDWYQETVYVDEKKQLKTKPNGAYTESVNNSLTFRSHRLGKVRLGNITEQSSEESLKDNQNDMAWKQYNENQNSDDGLDELQVDPDYTPAKKKEKKAPDQVQQVFDLFNNPAKVTWRMREIERVAAQALFDTYGIETLKIRIDRIEAEKNNKDPLFPLVTTPSQLLDKMPNVERYFGI